MLCCHALLSFALLPHPRYFGAPTALALPVRRARTVVAEQDDLRDALFQRLAPTDEEVAAQLAEREAQRQAALRAQASAAQAIWRDPSYGDEEVDALVTDATRKAAAAFVALARARLANAELSGDTEAAAAAQTAVAAAETKARQVLEDEVAALRVRLKNAEYAGTRARMRLKDVQRDATTASGRSLRARARANEALALLEDAQEAQKLRLALKAWKEEQEAADRELDALRARMGAALAGGSGTAASSSDGSGGDAEPAPVAAEKEGGWFGGGFVTWLVGEQEKVVDSDGLRPKAFKWAQLETVAREQEDLANRTAQAEAAAMERQATLDEAVAKLEAEIETAEEAVRTAREEQSVNAARDSMAAALRRSSVGAASEDDAAQPRRSPLLQEAARRAEAAARVATDAAATAEKRKASAIKALLERQAAEARAAAAAPRYSAARQAFIDAIEKDAIAARERARQARAVEGAEAAMALTDAARRRRAAADKGDEASRTATEPAATGEATAGVEVTGDAAAASVEGATPASAPAPAPAPPLALRPPPSPPPPPPQGDKPGDAEGKMARLEATIAQLEATGVVSEEAIAPLRAELQAMRLAEIQALQARAAPPAQPATGPDVTE